MKFTVGQTTSGYEFLQILDESEPCKAYKVRNVAADRFEVLRIMPTEPGAEARFLREIRVHARLSHPNVVSFYSASEIDGQCIVTTEYVRGITLAQRLEAGQVPLEDAVSYVRQALSALDYSHTHGIVHRGISPSSLMITSEGILKVTGLGFAKAPTDVQLTLMGAVIGSPAYVAPEQLSENKTFDARTDIYSLGAVFYELVTGRPPFVSKNQFELLRAHLDTIPRPPSEVCLSVPSELDLIILTALAKAPSQRFQSVKEFQNALSLCAFINQIPDTRPAAACP